MADRSHPPEVRFDELVQPDRLGFALLDAQVGAEWLPERGSSGLGLVITG